MGKHLQKTKLNSIILIQKKVIRAICGINDMRTNTSPLFYKCGILKFVDLIDNKTLINNLLGIQSIPIHTIQDKVNLIKNVFALP